MYKKNITVKKVWNKFLLDNQEVIKRMQRRAAEVHASVNQTYGGFPYSFHTNMVSSIFMQYGYICFSNYSDLRGAMDRYGLGGIFGSIFHDTIEDCRLTYNDVFKIAREFMGEDKARVGADIVYALTNEKGKTRDERANEKYYEGIRNTRFAPCIKLCDRYANALFANSVGSSMAKKYRKEMRGFIEHIYPADGCEASQLFLPDELVSACLTYPFCEAEETPQGDGVSA